MNTVLWCSPEGGRVDGDNSVRAWFRSLSAIRRIIVIFQFGFYFVYILAWASYTRDHGGRLLPMTVLFVVGACLYASEAKALDASNTLLRPILRACSTGVALLSFLLASVFIAKNIDFSFIPELPRDSVSNAARYLERQLPALLHPSRLLYYQEEFDQSRIQLRYEASSSKLGSTTWIHDLTQDQIRWMPGTRFAVQLELEGLQIDNAEERRAFSEKQRFKARGEFATHHFDFGDPRQGKYSVRDVDGKQTLTLVSTDLVWEGRATKLILELQFRGVRSFQGPDGSDVTVQLEKYRLHVVPTGM